MANVDEVVISPSEPSCTTRIGRHSPAISAIATTQATGSGCASSQRPSHRANASTPRPTTETESM
jgi:hypothetical protein